MSRQQITTSLKRLSQALLAVLTVIMLTSAIVSAVPPPGTGPTGGTTASSGPHQCGAGTSATDDPKSEEHSYTPSIEIGCQGKGNPILDLTFALIKFLSIGAGLVIVGSMVYAGLQYIGSRGDPNAHAQAVKRIQANIAALLIFIFAYSIVNYVVPGALLK